MSKLIEVYGGTLEDLKNRIEESQPLQMAFHSDSDGVASACLLASIFEVEESKDFPYSPSIFGAYREGNIAVDLGSPLFPSQWKGVIIDHHDHPNPSYPLIWGRIPTGGIIYEIFKDRIPEDKLWLVVLSLAGDGQPELIPDEIWDALPELWFEQGRVYKDKYRNVKAYPYPFFSKISPLVNSLCRTGNVMGAYKLVRSARGIRDIIFNSTALRAQRELSDEESRIYAGNDPERTLQVEKIGHFSLVLIRSKYHIAGRIAAGLQKGDHYSTYIVVNMINKEVSIRGLLAKYVANRLAQEGYLCGGHAGFTACSILPTQNMEVFVSKVREVLARIK